MRVTSRFVWSVMGPYILLLYCFLLGDSVREGYLFLFLLTVSFRWCVLVDHGRFVRSPAFGDGVSQEP